MIATVARSAPEAPVAAAEDSRKAAADAPKPYHGAHHNPDFTPPASPQPQLPHTKRKGFGSGRSRQPTLLQMDTAAASAHDRPSYNSSPSSSPTLPAAALPSPKFPLRQRAPSLLRHAAVPPPVSESAGPDAFPAASPVIAPSMSRQASGPASPDLRAIFNPLASNPVNSTGPAWNSSAEDLPAKQPPLRARGLTSTSQTSYQPNLPLRSVTSIPDYGHLRGSERANLSGTYKPNRGVTNWSHTDFYPPTFKHLRGEEPRASIKSAWTNASSFMDASGTERSSIVTARSSVISERQTSICSRDHSSDHMDDHEDARASTQTPEAPGEDEDFNAVDDLIDAYYCEEPESLDRPLSRQGAIERLSLSPATLGSEPPELSMTPSRDLESLDSFQSSSDSLKHWNDRPPLHLQDATEDGFLVMKPLPQPPAPMPAFSRRAQLPRNNEPGPFTTLSKDPQESYLPLSQHNMIQAHLQMSVPQPSTPTRAPQTKSRKRSSGEVPRKMSVSLQALTLDTPSSVKRADTPMSMGDDSRKSTSGRPQMMNIRREIAELPQLPAKKSRLSRQDWAEIDAYSKRHSKKPSGSRKLSSDSVTSRDNSTTVQSPSLKKSEPLPELDEDEAIPRRASTSVFDRKSTLINLGALSHNTASNNKSSARAEPPTPLQATPMRTDSARVRKVAPSAERDRYGFKKASDKISVQEYNAWAARYEEHISRRRGKWVTLMSKQGLSTVDPHRFPDMCEKVKRYARKGYPPEWRGAMWWYYSGGQHTIKQKEMVGLYATLAMRVKQGELNKDDKDAIERDLDRTFPDNIHFRPEYVPDSESDTDSEPPLIRDLREVLSCFALNNPSIGYCQSLNFIAGLLLLFLKQDKERVFILLTIITSHHLPGAHARSLANTEVNVLMMLIKDYLPKVWASINDTDIVNTGVGSNAHPNSKFQRQPTVALSCTSWFMSLFVGVLPIETVLRVWDSFLYEGPRALYRYALAIFKLGEPEIRKFRPGDGELFMAVQNLPRRCLDPNILHDLAFVKKGFGSLSQGVIDQKRLFWREQNLLAHQSSVRSGRTIGGPGGGGGGGGLGRGGIGMAPPSRHADDETDGESMRRAMGGLRRRASRRFKRMRS